MKSLDKINESSKDDRVKILSKVLTNDNKKSILHFL